MMIDSVRRIDRVNPQRIVNEAVSWGLMKNAAERVFEEIFTPLLSALEGTVSELEPPVGR